MPISPNQSGEKGSTVIVITGINLANATSVKFGNSEATIIANTATSITVICPSGAGVAQISVTTPGGVSNYLPFFYIPPPIVTALQPSAGPSAGGNSINIIGYGLFTSTSVSFGANTATPTIINDGTISVVVPSGMVGNTNVIVTTTGGISTALNYNYIDAPTIDSLNPTSGTVFGGTSVTIVGSNLLSITSITFDGNVASFGVINNTTIVAISPPGSAGVIDIIITTSAGSVTAASAFTYVNGPGI